MLPALRWSCHSRVRLTQHDRFYGWVNGFARVVLLVIAGLASGTAVARAQAPTLERVSVMRGAASEILPSVELYVAGVALESEPGEERLVLRLQLTFESEEQRILQVASEGRRARLAQSGSVALKLLLVRSPQALLLQEVDPYGTVREERAQIVVDDLVRLRREVKGLGSDGATDQKQRLFGRAARIDVGVGVQRVALRDETGPSQSGNTPTLAARWELPRLGRRWSLAGQGQLGLLARGGDASAAIGGFRLVEVATHARWRTPWTGGLWELSLLGGLGYASVLTSSDAYGFRSVTSLELYPRVVYRGLRAAEVGIEAGVMPVFERALVPSLSNDWRARLRVEWLWRRWSAFVSYDYLRLQIDSGSSAPFRTRSSWYGVGVRRRLF